MPRFEDRLWAELVEQHGALLADALPLAPAPRGRRLRLPAAGRLAPAGGLALALAAAIAALVIGFGSGHGSAAYAVALNPDGTVSITLRELAGVSGADERLQELGVPVRIVRAETNCPVKPDEYDRVRLPAARSGAISTMTQQNGVTTLVVDPSKIPPGDTVQFATRVLDPGPPEALGTTESVYRGPTPPCEAVVQ